MNKNDIRNYILPAYLLIALLIQIKTNMINVLLVITPIFLITLSIYKKHKKLGIISMFLFYILSLSLILLSNMNDYFLVFLQIFFIVIPSILLLSFVLQIENERIFIFSTNKKPIITSALLLTLIISVFYLLSALSWEGFLLSAESTPGQILLLAGLTIITCVPLLVFSKK